jgi:hypothetical protein
MAGTDYLGGSCFGNKSRPGRSGHPECFSNFKGVPPTTGYYPNGNQRARNIWENCIARDI